MEYGILSLVPTVIAVGLALTTKNVYVSLLLGLLAGNTIIAGGNPLAGIDGVIASVTTVFADSSNITTMLAISLMGGMILLIQKAGGVNGFIDVLTVRTSLIKSKKAANFITWVIGMIVFVSANMRSLIAGTIMKPLNDKYLTSPEKQCYIVHTVSAPVCALIPLSSWGAYMIACLENSGVENAAGVMVQSIPLSFYVIIAVFMCPILILAGKDFGPMKKAELRTAKENAIVSESYDTDQLEDKKASCLLLILPVLSMIVVTIVGMYFTGDGNILNGAGMRSFLWGVLSGIAIAFVMILVKKHLTFAEASHWLYEGWVGMLPAIIILTFALGLGGLVTTLGTGEYLANAFSSILSPSLLPFITFLIAMVIAFSTGSSWGTMAVVLPLVMPMAFTMDVNIPLMAGAVWSGGLFGDQSSPISDTTVVACSATKCEIPAHINSQLPYTLSFCAIAGVIYIIAGFII